MRDVALDACCLINLCAAGTILRPPNADRAQAGHRTKASAPAQRQPGFGLTLYVPSKVTGETLYIMQPDEEDPTLRIKRPIDLQEFMAAELLVPCDFQDQAEVDLFVQLATQLGDGEAACFAIAMKRGWTLGTDDRRARRFAANANLPVITTPELVKLWAENTQAGAAEIIAALKSIQHLALFVPRTNAPEYDWWMRCLDQTGEA